MSLTNWHLTYVVSCTRNQSGNVSHRIHKAGHVLLEHSDQLNSSIFSSDNRRWIFAVSYSMNSRQKLIYPVFR